MKKDTLTRDEILIIRDIVLKEVGAAMAAGDKAAIDTLNTISNKLYKMLER